MLQPADGHMLRDLHALNVMQNVCLCAEYCFTHPEINELHWQQRRW